MKTTKKIFAVLMSLLVVLIYSVPMTAFADGDDYHLPEWHYHNSLYHPAQWVKTGETVATCTEDATITFTCTTSLGKWQCNKTETVVLKGTKKDHEYGAWETVTEATCGTDGLEKRVCEHDSNHVEEHVIPATGKHTYGDYTCMGDGTDVAVCSGCGDRDVKACEHGDSINYTVEYYYNNEKDDSSTVEIESSYGSKITSYPDKAGKGYELNRVVYGDGSNDDALIIGTSNNTIKVYYTSVKMVKVAVYATDGSKTGKNTELEKVLKLNYEQPDGYYPIGVIELPETLFERKSSPYIKTDADWEKVKAALREIDESYLKGNNKGQLNAKNTVESNLAYIQKDLMGTAGSHKTALFDWTGKEADDAISLVNGKTYKYHLDLRFATDILSYDANGGTGTMPDTVGLKDKSVTVSECAFTKDGYTFTGWNTKSDGTGISYAVGSDYVLGSGATVLYAQWKENTKPITYKVTYTDGVEGEEVFEDQVYGNNKLNDPTPEFKGTPTREGYEFVVWTPEWSEKVTCDVTYTAQWKEKPAPAETYTVTYTDGVEGVEVFADQVYPNVQENDMTPKFNGTPTRPGYTFDKWVDTSGAEFTPKELAEKAVTGNVTYKAKWTQITDNIYVYVKLDGIFDAEAYTNLNLTQPASTGNGWYVMGPTSHAVLQKAIDLYCDTTVTISDDTKKEIATSIKDADRCNKGFNISSNKIAWNNLKVCDGAGNISGMDPFVANGINAYHLDGIVTLTNYTVNYVDEDTNEPIATAEIYKNVAVPETISAAAYSSKSINGYVQTSTSDDLSLTVENATGANSDREIIIYYSKDELSDPDEDKDKEKPGDGIPDKYQDTVTYMVVNGAWNNGSTSDVSEVVTFKLDGVPSNDANATAQLSYVPECGNKPAEGYIESGSWAPRTPETVQKAEDVREFTYTYRREEVVPVDPIVPPFTPESVYTVTYMDGVDDEVVFEDQSTTNLKKGDKTPAFTGEPVREGYKFIGWSPEVAETVSGDAVYYAQWEKLPEEPAVVDPSGDNDPIDDGKDIDAQPNGDADTDVEAKGVKTGDETMLAMWGALGLIAALGLGGTLVIGRRREE